MAGTGAVPLPVNHDAPGAIQPDGDTHVPVADQARWQQIRAMRKITPETR
jgi:hypothetical protein